MIRLSGCRRYCKALFYIYLYITTRVLNPHRHDDVAVIPALLSDRAQESLCRLVLQGKNQRAGTHRLEKIEQVFGVESDLEGTSRILEVHALRRFTDLGIIGGNFDASLAQRDLDRARALA